jgi:hypothetical protein
MISIYVKLLFLQVQKPGLMDSAMSDERILGGGEFVLKILEEAEEEIRNYYTADRRRQK